MSAEGYRFSPLAPEHAASLADLFAALVQAGDDAWFHPHPLTAAEAFSRAGGASADFFVVALSGERVVGYGMLRGWAEGYAVPSLGIALHPDVRGRGVAREFMETLHQAARARGASKVRLKVHPRNEVAVKLYRALGYEFSGEERGMLVGYFPL